LRFELEQATSPTGGWVSSKQLIGQGRLAVARQQLTGTITNTGDAGPCVLPQEVNLPLNMALKCSGHVVSTASDMKFNKKPQPINLEQNGRTAANYCHPLQVRNVMLFLTIYNSWITRRPT